MANSVLGSNLLDQLVPTVDRLRSTLHPTLGVRQYTVTIVKRKWTGIRPGQGTRVIVSELVLDPQPRVMREGEDGVLRPCGLDEAGEIVLTEVSLKYDEAELYQPPPVSGQTTEFYYRITDAQGQHIRSRTFIPSRAPVPDRERDIAWRVILRRYDANEDG